MTSQSGVRQPSRLKKWLLVIGGSILFLFLCVISAAAFALWGGGGEPATLAVAIRVNTEFIEALHNEEYDTAYGMLSEKFPQISQDKFIEVVQLDQEIFSSYKRLSVCQWEFWISDGRVVSSSAILYYGSKAIVVQSSLHKDSDTIWRVQGFQFRPDLDPVPWRLCLEYQ